MIMSIRKCVCVKGVTQGVGFRPFAWRLAKSFALTGWVQNNSTGLLLEIQGDGAAIDQFLEELERNPPPLARLDSIEVDEIPVERSELVFAIRSSEEQVGESSPVTQDISVCKDCLDELMNDSDRRFRYPFINCTNCGPRFTIVEDLPYDRPATTMKSFQMCARCQAEYDDPADRRFHAQPNACADCGPGIWFSDGEADSHKNSDESEPIARFSEAVANGLIVAVKGIGGFHLVCDASNGSAVAMLRERKGRVDKPFAIMAASIEQIATFAMVDGQEQALLESKERPIVLLRKRPDSAFQEMLQAVAPGNDFVGVVLPYTPLHYLLIETASPLVVTSGNISDEPIVRTNHEASTRLAKLADRFLFHDRDINVVCDDSVVRSVDGQLLPIRRSRGYAPMPVRLNKPGPSVLAVGGEIKATFCITKDDYAYLGQHIGDVGNIETLEALQRNVDHFLKLFRVEVEAVAGDLHPGYLSSQWARQLAQKLDVPFLPVQHHFAHAASLIAEHQNKKLDSIIACCFDGTGYGTDGAIWGGEFMLADDREFQRIAHLQYFPLPGGDASIKRPYRAALALLTSLGLDWDERVPGVAMCSDSERNMLQRQIEGNLNCADTSSIGRLFDAISSLIGIRHQVSYEAQAAMEMESLASAVINDVDPAAYRFDLSNCDPLISCESLVRTICNDVVRGDATAFIAARFHHAVANMICQVCERARDASGVNRAGLTGGVFQNVLLLKLTRRALKGCGFDVLSHAAVPPNDGGLALGQAIVAQKAIA